MLSIENVINSGLVSAITSMNISGGYNYDWVSAQQEDLTKVSFPHANLYLQPTEETLDSISFPNMDAFRNKQTYEIHCYNKLTTESGNSYFKIDETLNYMLHDIKKLIGSNPVPDYIESVEYIRATRKELNNGSDIILPKYLIVTVQVYYSQSRLFPDQLAC